MVAVGRTRSRTRRDDMRSSIVSFVAAPSVGMDKPTVVVWLLCQFAHAGTYAHLITGGLFATETGIWETGNKVLVILYIRFLTLTLHTCSERNVREVCKND